MNDILAQLQMLLSMPGVSDALEPMIQSILGTPGYGLNWLGNDPTKTLEYNVAATRRSRIFSRNLKDQMQAASEAITTNLLTNWHTMMGFDPSSARALAESGGVLNTLADTFLIQPQLQSAYRDIGNALYNRTVQWDPTHPYNQGRGKEYWQQGGTLLRSVMENAANRMYAGMGIADVGKIAGEMIRVGAFEEFVDDRGPTTLDRDNARIKKFSRELRDYAASVNVLRDVIDGPVEEILQSFEQLTGNRLVSMAPGRVSALANATRNVLSMGSIDAQRLKNLTAIQYGLIAPYGGTLAQANAMAINTAGALSYGVRIEGLSDLQLGTALAQDNARMLASGVIRNYAGAYTHWRRTNDLEDNPETKARFYREMQKRYGSTDQEAMSRYLADNNVSGAFLSSVSVTNAMADPTFAAQARLSEVSEYEKTSEAFIRRLGLGAKTGDILKLIRSTADIGRIEDALSKMGLNQNMIATIGNGLGLIARTVTGMDDTASAMGSLATSRAAANATLRTEAGDAFRKLQGLSSNGNGLEGLLNALQAADTNGFTIGRAIAAYSGLDYNAATEKGESFETKWKNAKSDEDKKQILQEAGLGDEDVKTFDRALKMGKAGVSILTAQGKEGVGEEAVRNAKRELLGASATASRGALQKLAKPLDIDQKDIAKLYLAQGTDREVTDKEVEEFEQARKDIDEQLGELGRYRSSNNPDEEGWLTEEEDAAERDKAARNMVMARRNVEAVRAELIKQKGGYVSNKELRDALNDQNSTSAYVQEFQKRRAALGEYADAESFTNSVTKQDGLMGILDAILEAIRGLKPNG